MSGLPELDDETKARLRWEAERLAAEQDMPLPEARKIVWLDYLDELAAQVVAVPPEPPPAPDPEPARLEPSRTGGKPFWSAKDEPAFTSDWLKRNRQQLAQVKRLVGAKQ